jgi:hypothetical protein
VQAHADGVAHRDGAAASGGTPTMQRADGVCCAQRA